VLKQPTRPVTVFDARLEKLAQVMMDVMIRGEGVGLAANQIGVLSRVMVWRNPENDEERHVWVNPQIVQESDARCTGFGRLPFGAGGHDGGVAGRGSGSRGPGRDRGNLLGSIWPVFMPGSPSTRSTIWTGG